MTKDKEQGMLAEEAIEPAGDDEISESRLKRGLYGALGGVFFGLGAVGAFLPVLPTTPFMLLALWAFSKSSRRLRDYVWSHPTYGPMVRAWRKYGAIPRRAKIMALLVMSLSASYLVFFTSAPPWALASALGLMAFGAGFVLTRPGMPTVDEIEKQ